MRKGGGLLSGSYQLLADGRSDVMQQQQQEKRGSEVVNATKRVVSLLYSGKVIRWQGYPLGRQEVVRCGRIERAAKVGGWPSCCFGAFDILGPCRCLRLKSIPTWWWLTSQPVCKANVDQKCLPLLLPGTPEDRQTLSLGEEGIDPNEQRDRSLGWA